MTREEILQIAKPILFNTDMVRAILDDKKTVTRRIIKCKYSNTHLEMFTNKYGTRLIEIQDDVEGETFGKNSDGTTWRSLRGYIETEYERKPYKKRQLLYVRETWANLNASEYPCYYYRASDELPEWALKKWRPSIHMPKEAARIFLRVTDVRVERLQNITDNDCIKEGICAWSKDGKLWKYAPADKEGDYPIWKWQDTPKIPQETIIRAGISTGLALNERTAITIAFDDSIIEDKSTERQNDRQDVAMGAMGLAKYRSKWYGETKEQAQQNLPEQFDGGVIP